jgi:hypothetical protein
MAKKLATHVHVEGEDGQMYVFGPNDSVPAWASKKMGDHVWAKDSEDEPELVAGPSLTIDETRRAEEQAKAGAKAAKDAAAGSTPAAGGQPPAGGPAPASGA